eukprot:356178-Chlamydomonas_euryale.AAC.3
MLARLDIQTGGSRKAMTGWQVTNWRHQLVAPTDHTDWSHQPSTSQTGHTYRARHQPVTPTCRTNRSHRLVTPTEHVINRPH